MGDKPLRRETPQLHIDELFAFISKDESGEGVISFADLSDPLYPVMMPMVGADMRRVESLKSIATRIKERTGTNIEIVRFSKREHIGEI